MGTKCFAQIALAFLIISLLQIGCASKESKVKEVDKREITRMSTFTATVQAIDLETREITLMNQNGEEVTFVVAPQVTRLDEILPGDTIKLEYYISLVSEIREPTEEEKNAPLTVLESTVKAPADISPARGDLRQIKAVVTIEDIDLERTLVTVKGPRGRYLTLKPLYPERLKLVEVGDTVIVTYTEALVTSLQKIE